MGEGGVEKQVSVRSLARWVFLIVPLGAVTLFSLWFIYFILAFALDSYGRQRSAEVGLFFDRLIDVIQVGGQDVARKENWLDQSAFPKSYREAAIALNSLRFSWGRIDCSLPIRLSALDEQNYDQTVTLMTSIWPEVTYVITPRRIPFLDDLLAAVSVNPSSGQNSGERILSKSENAKRIPLKEFRAYEMQLRSLYPDGFSWKSVECEGFAYVEIKG